MYAQKPTSKPVNKQQPRVAHTTQTPLQEKTLPVVVAPQRSAPSQPSTENLQAIPAPGSHIAPAISAPAFQTVPPAPSVSYTPEFLQPLVDQAAIFNLYAMTDDYGSQEIRTNSGDVVGFKAYNILHRFDIELVSISTNTGVKTNNSLSEVVGRMNMRWLMIPSDFFARPDSEPPPTRLDITSSQRFAMQEMTFSFGNGQDGFRSFGTGRTFPMFVNGKPKLVVAAIGNVTDGFGKFKGHEGNYILCGDLDVRQGFVGHILIRILDEGSTLRSSDELLLPVPVRQSMPDSDSTYLMWAAQKGKGKDQENFPSLDQHGEVRGLNIPMNLKHGSIAFTTQGAGGFRYSQLNVGEVIGREEGFGRGSIPGATQVGTALDPFLFEGVAQYSFKAASGQMVGAIKTNVLEGRRFDFQMKQIPGITCWRFGFFGPIIEGFGCFRGMTGMFYGASASIFNPPPGDHVITHIYMARLFDTKHG